MALNAALKGVLRLVAEQLQTQPSTSLPAIKGVGSPLQESRFDIFKLFFVAGGSLGLGGWIAHEGAQWLDNRGYFTPSDDDDDD